MCGLTYAEQGGWHFSSSALHCPVMQHALEEAHISLHIPQVVAKSWLVGGNYSMTKTANGENSHDL